MIDQRYFILDGHVPKPVPMEEWARWFGSSDRTVRRTETGGAAISTVFLGLDHSFGGGPPLLFETMIFGGEHDGYQDRCSTWAQAEAQHEEACALVRRNLQ